jgi:RNA polymerase sigma-70 factor (ECF subfamily)
VSPSPSWLAEVDGPAAALALVEELDLRERYLLHAIRADLLRRLGRAHEASEAYGEAIARTGNEAEQAFLAARRAE